MFSRKFMWHKPPPKASTPSSKLAYSLTCFSAVRRVLSPFLPTFVAALMFGLLAPLTANAAPVNVPLSTIADAPPQNGALSNGVNWSVELDPGPASDPRGWRDGTVPTSSHYAWYPQDGIQIWRFSTPVNLSFILTNFNGNQEGMVMPLGTACDLSNVDPAFFADFNWDPATATLVQVGPDDSNRLGIQIPCTLNNTTELTFDGTGLREGLTRGLYSLTVTPVANPFNTSTAPVPALNPVTLVGLALALLGLAGLMRKRRV